MWTSWSCAIKPAEMQVGERKRLTLPDLEFSTSAPTLMLRGQPSVLPGPGIPGWPRPSAPGIITNSNSRRQGINRVFKCTDSSAPPAGLNVIWEKGSSWGPKCWVPVLVSLGPVTSFPWTSVSWIGKMGFSNLLRGLSWAPTVKVVLHSQAQGQAFAGPTGFGTLGPKSVTRCCPRDRVGRASPDGRGRGPGCSLSSAPFQLRGLEKATLPSWASCP